MCKQILKDQIYECNGQCSPSGTVWGTGLYSGDSNIYLAAKHSGLIPGRFTKKSQGPQNNFQGTTQNDITTSSYGYFATSYTLSPFSCNIKPQVQQIFQNFNKQLLDQLQTLQYQYLEELEQEQQQMICTVCNDNPRQYLVFPCCHAHFCHTCIKLIIKDSKCSVCSKEVTGHLRVFI